MKLITSVFGATDASRILRIPLASSPHEDSMVWRHDLTYEFTVKNTYKLLHKNSYDPRLNNLQTFATLYKKLWNTDLP